MVKMRNKDKHTTDWTTVLQERLRDASLPLEDGWAAGAAGAGAGIEPETLADPARSGRKTWGRAGNPGESGSSRQKSGGSSRKSGFSGSWAPWGWALAGAAAAITAVLVLRPAAPSGLRPAAPAGEEPVRLVEAPAAEVRGVGAAQDLAVAQSLTAVAQTPDVTQARIRNTDTNPSTKQTGSKDGAEEKARPSTNQALNMDGTEQTGNPSTNRTGNGDEIPGQARNDGDAARSGGDAGRSGGAAARNNGKNSRSGGDAARKDGDAARKGGDATRNDGDAARSDIAQAGQPVQQQSLEELTQGDFATAGEPGAADVARRRRPVSLRLQAATPGASLAAGRMFAAGPVVSSDPKSYSDPGYGDSAKPGGNVSQAPSADRAPVFPVSVGISAAVPLSRRWTLAAGLEYTQRAGAVVQSAAGSSSAQSVTLHYLGVPLDLHCYLNPDDRLRVWLGGGLKAEKAIHVTGSAPLRDPVLCSWNLQAGADLRVLPGVRIYLSPALTRYLNHSAYAVNWDERSNFSLRAGLSFDLK